MTAPAEPTPLEKAEAMNRAALESIQDAHQAIVVMQNPAHAKDILANASLRLQRHLRPTDEVHP